MCGGSVGSPSIELNLTQIFSLNRMIKFQPEGDLWIVTATIMELWSREAMSHRDISWVAAGMLVQYVPLGTFCARRRNFTVANIHQDCTFSSYSLLNTALQLSNLCMNLYTSTLQALFIKPLHKTFLTERNLLDNFLPTKRPHGDENANNHGRKIWVRLSSPEEGRL